MGKTKIKKTIKELVQRLPQGGKIKKISLFGSCLSGSARRGSDVDLLIEFQSPVGYFELIRLQRAFEKKMRKRVDLVTPGALSKYFRSKVTRQAEMIYEK